MSEPVFASFAGLGTTVKVGATDPGKLDAVTATVRQEVADCDRACSRFRADSELSRLNTSGSLEDASEWLVSAVTVALKAAEQTGGLVEPTLGQALVSLGYDRTFDRLQTGRPLGVTVSHVPAWPSVVVDHRVGRVSIPATVRLDLGATAKALCADRAASRAADVHGTGVLVSLGGDISFRGEAPDGGWRVRVTDRSDADPSGAGPGQVVAMATGALATSGTTARRWTRGGASLHHVLDPRTGWPAAEIWRTVSVAAPTCVAANTASTAAVILGEAAVGWLEDRRFDARLVRGDGRVVMTGEWPADAPLSEAS